MGSSIDDGPTGKYVTDLVRMLAEVRQHEGALEFIQKATTSCKEWGGALQQLMNDTKVFGKAVLNNAKQFLREIEMELGRGRSVMVSLKLPTGRRGCGEHVLCIEAHSDGQNARVLHAWQGRPQLRAEKDLRIDELLGHLKELPDLDWTVPQQRHRVGEICGELWGQGHDEVPRVAEQVGKKRVSFEMMISGEVHVEGPLTDPRGSRQLSTVLGEASEWMKARSGRSGATFNAAFEEASCEEVSRSAGRINIRMGGVVGGGLGFVFGVGGALLSGERNPRVVVLEGLKPGLAGAAGAVAGAAAAGALAAGVAFSAVLAIWDVAAWKMHSITQVEMRQRMAANVGGAAGGISVGAGAGLAAGMYFGPMGVVLGGILGGVVGGIGGVFAGQAIDNAVWDESEDAVMNSYEFFGWHDVGRSTRPVKTPEEMGQVYDKKLAEKPEKMEGEDWNTICLATLMVLLPAMYPEFTELMKLGDDLQKNKSDGLSTVATLMFESLHDENKTDEEETESAS